ncbi:MAG: PstS family phosphate ABC transporter substrate-binding protein [Tepidisphaeraceae bacterium]
MNKLTVSLAALTIASGCTQPRSAPPASRQTVAPILSTATPTTAATAPTPPPVGSRVVEIITHPVLVKRATTRPTGGDASSLVTSRNVPTPKLTLDDLKRVDTSVATAPLLRLLAMKLNGIPYQRFAGFGAVDFTPSLPEGTDPDAATNDVLSREPAGPSSAIGRLIKGEIDLAIIPRQPTTAELAYAVKSGVQLRSDLAATEALVFTVNVDNPVHSLTQKQLVDIFTGNVVKWKDLGTDTVPPNSPIAPDPITVAYRARGTGSEELLEQLLLNGQKPPELPISKALMSSKLVLDASSEDPETIGFSGFCYAINMKRDSRIKVLAVDNILPEPARVASGEYPLTTPLYLITRTDLSSDTDIYKLRTWLGTMAGQKTLAEAGYMPISSEAWTEARLMEKQK